MKNCAICQHCIKTRNVWDAVFDQEVWLYFCEVHQHWFYGACACRHYVKN